MEGSYAEWSVKKENKGTATALRALMIIGIVALAVAGLLFASGVLIFIALAGGLAYFYVAPLLNIEYEYVYVNGQFDFDRITNNNGRKKLLRIDLDNADHLSPVRNNPNNVSQNNSMQQKDFTSRREHARVYEIVGPDQKGKMTRVLFEPSDEILNLVRQNPTYRRKLQEY